MSTFGPLLEIHHRGRSPPPPPLPPPPPSSSSRPIEEIMNLIGAGIETSKKKQPSSSSAPHSPLDGNHQTSHGF
ncbi:hypothetical protein EYF80_041946 [Liparis tanakae]|uniref:Uncharacterized protein n=1 Tax=Liparis tanakae TaxID=230148 RepID=A0A4Z2G5I3_9TELE|nr:hypothetical protein EYF80_041946 [Liparis tanakae]